MINIPDSMAGKPVLPVLLKDIEVECECPESELYMPASMTEEVCRLCRNTGKRTVTVSGWVAIDSWITDDERCSNEEPYASIFPKSIEGEIVRRPNGVMIVGEGDDCDEAHLSFAKSIKQAYSEGWRPEAGQGQLGEVQG